MRFIIKVSILLTLLLSLAIAMHIAYPYPYIFATLSTAVVLALYLSSIINISKDLGTSVLTHRINIPKKHIYILLILFLMLAHVTRYIGFTSISAALFLPFYFVVGYSIIKVIGLTSLLDNLEITVFAFILGSTYIALITFVSSILFDISMIRIILSLLIFMNLLLLFREANKKVDRYLQFNLDNSTLCRFIMIIVVILTFYAFYYRDFVYIPGTDITRHYMFSVNIVRNPLKFIEITLDYYHFFHAYLGSLIVLSGERNFDVINLLFILVNIVYIVSIIPFVRTVLKKSEIIYDILAFISTFIFTGLGWLYLLFNPPTNVSQYFVKLIEGNSRMYNNLRYAPSPFMWPAPISFATATYLLSLSLVFKIMRTETDCLPVSGGSLGMVALMLAITMMGTHPPEAFMFTLVLFLTIIFVKESRILKTLNKLVTGFITGLVVVGLVDMAITVVASHPVTTVRLVAFFGPAILLGSAWMLRKVLRQVIGSFTRINIMVYDRVKGILSGALLYIIIGLFTVGILTALDTNNEFYTHLADPGGVVGLVPWFIYPIILGLVLPLGVIGITHVFLHDKDSTSRIIAKILVLIIMISTIIGRVVSYLNMNGVNTGYWGEKRFLMFVYLALLPYAVHALKRLSDLIGDPHRQRSVIITIVLSLLIVISFSNALVISSYWNISSSKYKIDELEYTALTKLRDIVWDKSDKWILTPTIRSRSEVVLSAPTYAVFADPSNVFRFSLAETALRNLRPYGLDTPYVYVDRRTDIKVFSSGWIGTTLIPSVADKVFEMGPITVYDIPSLAPVLPSSKTALVLPMQRDLVPWMDKAFLLLSRLGLNYTTVLEADPSIIDHNIYKTLILPYDPIAQGTNITVNTLSKELAGYWRRISGRAILENEVLKLGDPERPITENIAIWKSISSIGVNNINISLIFKVEEYDPKVLNYIYLVYDYIDKNNYKFLGIMLENKGKVYALSCSKNVSGYICDPPWPGIYIGDSFDPSIDHRLSISLDLRQRIARLKLDNYKSIMFYVNIYGGAIGVRVDRFYSVTIRNLVLDLEIRPLISLMDLIEGSHGSNRTIIVMNTAGHGDIYNMLSKKEHSTLLSTNGAEVYLEHVDSATIIYLDLKSPLEDTLRDESVVDKLRQILQHYLSTFDVKNYSCSIMMKANIITDEIIFSNAEIISRSYILLPLKEQILCIDTACYYNSTVEFIAIKPYEQKTLKISADNVSISKGVGFYALIRATKVVIPANTTVQSYLSNSSFSIFKLSQELVLNNVTIISKTPIIITNESSIRGVLYQGLRFPYIAKDLVLKGTSTIEYVVGDDLLLLKVKTSNVEFIEGLGVYDEATSLPLLFKYGLIYVLALILIITFRVPQTSSKR